MPRLVDDFIQAHLEFAKGREGAEIYHRWSATTAISAALERKVWLDRGQAGGIFYPNVYVLLIGPSANGKTYSAELAMEHVKRIRRITNGADEVCFTADKLTPAVLAEQLGEAEQTVAIGERSILQSPVFAYSGELAVYLTDIGGGSIIPDLLRYYDPGGTPELNVFKKRTISKGEIVIHNPSLVLLGCTVPDYLKKVLLGETAGYGFASRTIFVVSHENDRVIVDPAPEDKVLGAKLAATLTHIHTNMIGIFKETKKATARYRDWYVPFRKDFDERRKGMNRVEEEYYGRKKVHIFKLAMLLSASETDALTIEERHIEGALSMLEEVEKGMFSVTGNISQNDDFYSRLEKLYYLVPLPPKGITLPELRRASFQIFPQHREFLEAIKRLREAEAVVSIGEEDRNLRYTRDEKTNPFRLRVEGGNGQAHEGNGGTRVTSRQDPPEDRSLCTPDATDSIVQAERPLPEESAGGWRRIN